MSSEVDRERTLLLVGSNPPVTSGTRTMARAKQAQEILRFDNVVIANLFGHATYRTGDITSFGTSSQGWIDARPILLKALESASGILLAYGIVRPAGEAATHHTEQVQWLESHIQERQLPVWWVGGSPRHPSRWQRYTSRTHPEVDFRVALKKSLQLRPEA